MHDHWYCSLYIHLITHHVVAMPYVVSANPRATSAKSFRASLIFLAVRDLLVSLVLAAKNALKNSSFELVLGGRRRPYVWEALLIRSAALRTGGYRTHFREDIVDPYRCLLRQPRDDGREKLCKVRDDRTRPFGTGRQNKRSQKSLTVRNQEVMCRYKNSVGVAC